MDQECKVGVKELEQMKAELLISLQEKLNVLYPVKVTKPIK